MQVETITTAPSLAQDAVPVLDPRLGSSPTPRSKQRLDWFNLLFISSCHALALVAVFWLIAVRTSPWTIGLGVLWFALCGLAVTGGYHRLFAHPTYRAVAPVRLFYLLFGAGAVQNSALKWSSDHRIHHSKTDRDEDPYNIRRGFWWAHMGWIFHQDSEPGVTRGVKDLAADKYVAFQDRYYIAAATIFGFLLPGALGLLWGDPIGALLVAGFLRLVIQWHATGAVNSYSHRFGSQPYSRANSARDSSLAALLTLGEGYHNFHHRFQADYRNGVRWWHFDPTKWFVWTLERLSMARDLRRTPVEAIARARAAVLAEIAAERAQSVRGPRS
jgi:stearoyl-CoA desaturase (delta-9 desaturase)